MNKKWLWPLLLTVSSPAVLAWDRLPDRWFEVEVILFTREIPENSIRESFDPKVKPITYRRNRDLLSKFHYPDTRRLHHIMGSCTAEEMIKPLPERILPPGEHELAYLKQQQQLLLPDDYEPPFDLANLDPVGPFEFTPEPEPVAMPFDDLLPVERCGPRGIKLPEIPMLPEAIAEVDYGMFPRVIISGEKTYNNYVHLISPPNFKLREIYRTLRRQPDIRPILHTAWREPAGAEKYSRATRLYAGYDYTGEFDFQGNPIDQNAEQTPTPLEPNDEPLVEQTPQSVVDQIEQRLAMINNGARVNYHEQTIESLQPEADHTNDPRLVREIDGLFRIYIDPFNYLHIVADFNVRKAVEVPLAAGQNDGALITGPQVRLENFSFSQTRRVITKQLHYFDHPYMGMIVQIRRHGW